MEDVKSEKIEYLFLDIEWNQAPGTSDLDGREAIQIGVVAVDEQIQKVKTFSKAIRLSDPKLFNKKTEILSHTPLANIMQGNEEKAVLEKFAQSFPQYCHLIVWSRAAYDLFLKWYFKGSATERQKKILETIIAKGSPDESFLWPMELIVPAKSDLYGYIMPLRPQNYKSSTGRKAGSKYPVHGYGSQSEVVWHRSGIYL